MSWVCKLVQAEANPVFHVFLLLLLGRLDACIHGGEVVIASAPCTAPNDRSHVSNGIEHALPYCGGRLPGLRDDHSIPAFKADRVSFGGCGALVVEYDAPGFVWCGLVAGGRLLQFQHQRFALARRVFCGVEVWIPDNPEQFLIEAYGPNWTRPDPFFPLWASPNLIGGFDNIGRSLAIWSVFLALYHNYNEKALKYCRHARLLSEKDPLFEDVERSLLS